MASSTTLAGKTPCSSLSRWGGDKANPVPVNGTTVQAVWTDTGVTFGFKLAEPEMDKLKAKCTRHDQDVYGDDCVEMFLDISGERRKYYQIVANALGTIYDGTAEGYDWNAAGTKADGVERKGFLVSGGVCPLR